MPRITNREIGLKTLEIMLEVGGVAGAFFSTIISDKTNYLSFYSLFFVFAFSSYILLQKNMKINLGIFVLSLGTVTTFISIIGMPLVQFVVGPISYLSGILLIGLLIFLLFTIWGSYKKR